jgi:DNA-binding SARP family transcriptional activator
VREPEPGWRTANEKLAEQIARHLLAARYGQAAELLEQLKHAREEQGAELTVHMLEVARGLCLDCRQQQATAQWHREASALASERERELREQLGSLLELFSEGDLSVVSGEWDSIPQARAAQRSVPRRGMLQPVEPLSLWQRILGALPWRLGPQPPEKLAPETPKEQEAQEPSPPPAQRKGAAPPEISMPEREEVAVPPAETPEQEKPVAHSLVVYCLGSFRVYQDDQLITDWDSLKAKGILKYLVMHHGTPIVKDVLMEVFWPEAEPEAARRNLHQAVYALRKTLKRRRPDFPYVWFESDCYLLNPDTRIWLDFEQFEQHYRDGQRLEAAGQTAEAIEKYGIAESLYQGDFLEEDLYEDWPAPQRRHLRTLYLQMADRLSEYYVRQGDLAAAIVLCRKILSLDNCCEEAHRRLMECYLAQGQRHLAVRQYQACEHALAELELAPSEETEELYQQMTIGR